MPTEIKCPNCGTVFEPSDSMREAIEQELRVKMKEWQKKKEEEYQQKEKENQLAIEKKETELNQAFEQEKNRFRQVMEENLRKTIQTDYENQLKMLEKINAENQDRLKDARQKELEYLQKAQELKNREAELELSIQRKMQEERAKLSEELRKLEEQKTAARDSEYQLRLKELEKQLEDQKKLAEEMKRRAEQGSMQLQGEVQELALEELLRQAFPFDELKEVGKGVRGADCIQIVRNALGQECGKIIYESKRTKRFEKDWIEKLKADMRSQSADVAVIVSQVMPESLNRFGQIDGVWVCSFHEVAALAQVLRESILRIHSVTISQENRGDKMNLLYNYLMSREFGEQWQAIREGFQAMKLSIQKERDAMERLWKAREKQLEKVLLNAAHIRGSIEGIAGQNSPDLDLLEDGTEDLVID